ncbi:hypothetical protein D3C87_1704800 [compost metagenome]
MYKPFRIVVVVMAQAENPVTATLLIFYAIVIPVKSILNPPFLFYSFRAIGFAYIENLIFIPEQYRRIVWQRHSNFNSFGSCK